MRLSLASPLSFAIHRPSPNRFRNVNSRAQSQSRICRKALRKAYLLMLRSGPPHNKRMPFGRFVRGCFEATVSDLTRTQLTPGARALSFADPCHFVSKRPDNFVGKVPDP